MMYLDIYLLKVFIKFAFLDSLQVPSAGSSTKVTSRNQQQRQQQEHCQKCYRPTRSQNTFASTVTPTSKGYNRKVVKKEEDEKEEDDVVEDQRNGQSIIGLNVSKGSKIPSNRTLRRILNILKETSV